MSKIKNFFTAFKYETSIFAVLCANFLLFFTKGDIMSDAIYPMHLVDLKIGFISRTLVGTVNGILWEHPTKNNVMLVHTAVTIITFLLTAVFLGKCIKKADEQSGKNLFILSLIIAVFPYGFMTYINLFELLDIYWVMSAVLCLLVADGKKAAFLIPVFIVTGLWAHYSFVLAFMPLIYIMCFYKCIKEKSRSTYAMTGLMIAVSVSFTLYFFLTSRDFNIITFDEFTEYIIGKAGDKITQFETYCGEAFRPYDEIPYDYYIEKYGIPEWLRDTSDIKRAFYGYFIFAFKDGSISGLIADIVLASPIIVFFEAIWKKAMTAASDKAEKFIYFLCLISPIIGFIALLTSSDSSRWLSLIVISNLFLTAIFTKERAVAVSDSISCIMKKLNEHKPLFIFILTFYLAIVFVW